MYLIVSSLAKRIVITVLTLYAARAKEEIMQHPEKPLYQRVNCYKINNLQQA